VQILEGAQLGQRQPIIISYKVRQLTKDPILYNIPNGVSMLVKSILLV